MHTLKTLHNAVPPDLNPRSQRVGAPLVPHQLLARWKVPIPTAEDFVRRDRNCDRSYNSDTSGRVTEVVQQHMPRRVYSALMRLMSCDEATTGSLASVAQAKFHVVNLETSIYSEAQWSRLVRGLVESSDRFTWRYGYVCGSSIRLSTK